MSKQALVIDIETSDLSGDTIWCVGLTSADRSWCFEWSDLTNDDAEYLTELCANHTPVFHNAQFDVRVLREHGVDIAPGSYFDTMVASYVWNPRRETGHSLESWGAELGYHKIDYLQACKDAGLLPQNAKKGDEHALPYDQLKHDYCIRDCELTFKLYQHLKRKFETDPKALKLLLEVELPYIDVLIEYESTGFYIDVEGSEQMVAQLERGQDELLEKIREIIPLVPGKVVEYKRGSFKRNGEVFYNRCELDEFNPNSNRHIIYALMKLYDWEPETFGDRNQNSDNLWAWLYDMHITGIAKDTPEYGQPKVDADTLESLGYPLTELLTEYAVLAKMHGMVTGYLERLDGRRLYGSFNQCLTKTGRLSSSNPNLQNIPTNGVWGEKMRSLFTVPNDDWVMVGCDLSNIEGRVLAHYLSLVCKDHRMSETFAEGTDFHQVNADMWGITRKEAKTALYGLLYGAGPTKLGGGDKKRGKEIIDSIYAGMPSIKQLKEMVWDTCRKRGGLIHDAFGRRLYYPEINEDYAMRKVNGDRLEAKQLVAQAERRVFNALLQGTAGSVLKVLALDVWRNYQEPSNAWAIAAVHDEVLFYVPQTCAEEFRLKLGEVFSMPLLSNCPIKGDPKTGNNWNDIH